MLSEPNASSSSDDTRREALHPELFTSRLRLRPLVAADVHSLHASFSDPETMRFMDFPPTRDVAESSRAVSALLFVLPEWHATWAVEWHANGAVVGFVNYHHRETWNQRL